MGIPPVASIQPEAAMASSRRGLSSHSLADVQVYGSYKVRPLWYWILLSLCILVIIGTLDITHRLWEKYSWRTYTGLYFCLASFSLPSRLLFTSLCEEKWVQSATRRLQTQMDSFSQMRALAFNKNFRRVSIDGVIVLYLSLSVNWTVSYKSLWQVLLAHSAHQSQTNNRARSSSTILRRRQELWVRLLFYACSCNRNTVIQKIQCYTCMQGTEYVSAVGVPISGYRYSPASIHRPSERYVPDIQQRCRSCHTPEQSLDDMQDGTWLCLQLPLGAIPKTLDQMSEGATTTIFSFREDWKAGQPHG